MSSDPTVQAPLIHCFPGGIRRGAGYGATDATALGSLIVAEALPAAANETIELGPHAFDCGSTIPSTTPRYVGSGTATTVTINQTIASLASLVSRCCGMTIVASDATINLDDAGIRERPLSAHFWILSPGFDVDTNRVGYWLVSPAWNGLTLSHVQAWVFTPGSGGSLTTIRLDRYRNGSSVEMLSTRATIDHGERSSETAATPPVINPAYADLVTSDLIKITVPAVSTTAPQGLFVTLDFS